MRILFLCDRKTYDTKMSRVRFHSIDALKRYPGVNLKKHGPGWGSFDPRKLEKNFKPDLIIVYKPLKIEGFNKFGAPKCLRYNEMWSTEWTKKEIKNSDSKLVTCVHFNDIQRYAGNLDTKFKLVHVPHCGEIDIFKDYKQKKNVDVLFVGKPSRKYYPLRHKLSGPVRRILSEKGVNFQFYKHPGYELEGSAAIKKQQIQYAKAINSAKIVVSCASVFKYALAKYVEVPLCRTCLCGNIPDENQDWYRSWMLSISMDSNADTISKKIINLLNNKERLEYLTNKGYEENLKHRTQEIYAKKFVRIAEKFLNGELQDYDFTRNSEKYLNGGSGYIEL